MIEFNIQIEISDDIFSKYFTDILIEDAISELSFIELG